MMASLLTSDELKQAGRLELAMKSAVHPYHVTIAPGCVTEPRTSTEFLKDLNPEKTILVCDRRLRTLYSRSPLLSLLKTHTLFLPATENEKTLEGVRRLYDYFLKKRVTRKHRIVALGGGIIQDVAGFACQTYMRGLEWWLVPSTLLAQADSCVGSKNSINYASTKNILGSFYPPHRVLIDPALLRSLDPTDRVSGLGESLKVHCMDNPDSLTDFIQDIPALKKLREPATAKNIRRSLAIKWRYVEPDEFDRGTRQVLNFGHCYGHAIEAASKFVIPHGIGVILGIVFSYALSVGRRLVSENEYRQVSDAARLLLSDLAVPNVKPGAILKYLRKDKKREGVLLAVILTRGVGEPFKALDVTEEEFYSGAEAVETLLKGVSK